MKQEQNKYQIRNHQTDNLEIVELHETSVQEPSKKTAQQKTECFEKETG